MKRVKILGAGSIGNHLSHAARSLGWVVDLCDVDPMALERTRLDIYPARYGKWDEEITLYSSTEAPKGGYDLIIVGTPPDTHIRLAREALEEKPKAILVEKPLCPPDLMGAQDLYEESQELNIPIFVGYNHVVSLSSKKFESLLKGIEHDVLETLDVEFREFWGGIFKAHPWLDGPADTYLGYWKRGGGASGEHSHAANLWQHFSHLLGAGRIVEVTATLDYVKNANINYDKLALINVKTETGLIGRIVQDVVTNPSCKWARLQTKKGYLEWHCNYKPDCDAVLVSFSDVFQEEYLVHKTRPDDFIQELSHIEQCLKNNVKTSPISLERGLDTMLLVVAMHQSALQKQTISINYNVGYKQEALVPVFCGEKIQ